MATSQRNTARVKWFNSGSGYGFITDCVSNEDVFVHYSALSTKNEVYKTLNKGEYIEYDIHVDESGKKTAVNVSGVLGGPLQCELQTPRASTSDTTPATAHNRFRGRGGRGRGRRGRGN